VPVYVGGLTPRPDPARGGDPTFTEITPGPIPRTTTGGLPQWFERRFRETRGVARPDPEHVGLTGARSSRLTSFPDPSSRAPARGAEGRFDGPRDGGGGWMGGDFIWGVVRGHGEQSIRRRTAGRWHAGTPRLPRRIRLRVFAYESRVRPGGRQWFPKALRDRRSRRATWDFRRRRATLAADGGRGLNDDDRTTQHRSRRHAATGPPAGDTHRSRCGQGN